MRLSKTARQKILDNRAAAKFAVPRKKKRRIKISLATNHTKKPNAKKDKSINRAHVKQTGPTDYIWNNWRKFATRKYINDAYRYEPKKGLEEIWKRR
jgi:hypothetical protein